MTKLSLSYLMSIILFLNLPQRPLPRVLNQPPILNANSPPPKMNLSKKLLRAYILGQKYKLPKKIKLAHQKLSLGHLFTPSGLHFTSFLIFINLLLFRIRKKNKFYNLFFLLIYLIPFGLSGYLSLKRIAFLRIGLLFEKIYLKKENLYWVFIITFFIDGIFGTYKNSPLSFTYSFLFIGTILSAEKKPYSSLILPLFGAHIIISYFQLTHLYPMGFLLGFLLTTLFTFTFPVLLIIYFLNIEWLEFIVEGLLDVIIFSSKFHNLFGSFDSSLAFIFFVLVLSTKWKLKESKILWTLVLLLHSGPILNLPKRKYSKKSFYNLKPDREKENIKKIKRTKSGYKVNYYDGLICYYKINNHFLEKNCRW